MKSKTLGLIAFISIALTAICWAVNFILGLFDANLGRIGSALTLIANVCSIIVLLFAAYEWVKTQKKSVKIIYWVITVLAILSMLGISVLGFTL